MNPAAEIQPAWVCAECGYLYGRAPAHKHTDWSRGRCEVCGEDKPAVADPRDFSWMQQGWMGHRK